MPTTMLTLAWLLATTTHFAAFAPPADLAPQPSAAFVAFGAQPPMLAAPPTGNDPDRAEWLLFESESDEETEDGEAIGTALPVSGRPALRLLFGAVVSNRHSTILPRSALRSPTLRC